jgi:hypothetical protein
MLLYALFDVDISEYDDGTHILVCPDSDEFYVICKVVEGKIVEISDVRS